ncbi:MAG: outer membrane beta-barrel domain-containing protein [Pseudomonadales bacterium]|nr:outer membrane beta-barrel domain-containing protein [Pseudomonadales bacterium]
MESRIQRIFLMEPQARILTFLVLFLVGFIPLSQADDSLSGVDNFQPEVERKEIDKPDIDTEDFEFGVSYGLMSVEDFGVNGVFVTRLAYHVNEQIFVEGIYGQTDTEQTSFEILSNTNLLTDEQREYQYYNVSVGYNILPGEVFFGENKTFVSELYLVVGAGTTEFAGDKFFTLNIGAGYRLLLTDEIALHLDMRDNMLNMDLLGVDKTSHNIEVTGGLTYFF